MLINARGVPLCSQFSRHKSISPLIVMDTRAIHQSYFAVEDVHSARGILGRLQTNQAFLVCSDFPRWGVSLRYTDVLSKANVAAGSLTA
jgi:hypothetical protein